MGTSMASVSFRKPNESVWNQVKPRIENWLDKTEGLTNNLRRQSDGFAIVSPYGDGAPILGQIAPQISTLLDGYSVFSVCCDSDFCLLEVYNKGEVVEKCYVGELFEGFMEFEEYSVPNLEFWRSLLVNPSDSAIMEETFAEDYVFAEDFLRKLSLLIGMPVFDDILVYEDGNY